MMGTLQEGIQRVAEEIGPLPEQRAQAPVAPEEKGATTFPVRKRIVEVSSFGRSRQQRRRR